MRYTLDNGVIEAKPILPIKPNWKNISHLFIILSPGLIASVIASMTRWDEYDPASGEFAPTIIGGSAFVMLFFGFIICFFWCIAREQGLFKFKKKQSYGILYLNEDHLDIPIYKEAYKECLEDIKNNNFDRTEWSVIFRNLSSEADRLKEGDKQMKKITIPKRDFAGELKESNDMYLKGIK